MVKHLCVYCSKVKYEDEFYSTNLSRCKACLIAYSRERYNEKRMEKKLREQSCMGCGVVMRNPQSKICQKCARQTDKFDIKTANDYRLTGDVTLNGIAFLHACGNGILDAFFEKCFTATDAYNEETCREPSVHVNDVDPASIEAYDEHTSHWFEAYLLKRPQSAVARHMRNKLERKLSE